MKNVEIKVGMVLFTIIPPDPFRKFALLIPTLDSKCLEVLVPREKCFHQRTQLVSQ